MADTDGEPEVSANIEPTPEPDPTPPAPQTDTALTELVHNLSQKVDELTETVATLVTKGDPDTTPVKKPWTHWGSN